MQRTLTWLVLAVALVVMAAPWVAKSYLNSHISAQLALHGQQYLSALADELSAFKQAQAFQLEEAQAKFSSPEQLVQSMQTKDMGVYAVAALSQDRRLLLWGGEASNNPSANLTVDALLELAALRAEMTQSAVLTPVLGLNDKRTVMLLIPNKDRRSAVAYVLFLIDTKHWLPPLSKIGLTNSIEVELLDYTAITNPKIHQLILNYPNWSGLWSLKFEYVYVTPNLMEAAVPIMSFISLLIVLLLGWHIHQLRKVNRFQQALDVRDAQLAKQEQMSLLGEVATNLAHELNQPLAAISNYSKAASLALHRTGDAAQVNHALQKIEEQTQRASKIIQTVRTLIGGTSRMEDRWVDMAQHLKDLVASFKPRAKQIQARIDLEIEAGLPSIHLSETLLEMVISNLLRNALDALENQEKKGNKRVKVKAYTTNEMVCIEVGDNGPGIASEIQSKIFEPFFSTKPQGMGIGLSFCRTSIEKFGGNIRLLHNGSSGTTFEIQIPLNRAKKLDF